MDVIPCLFLVRYGFVDVIILMSVLLLLSKTHGYDPLDPNGNITIRWDVMQANDDGSQDVKLSLVNYQLFRHIELPGWKLSFAWPGDEVIWDVRGAEATEQGDCSRFKGTKLPHCCEKKPVVIDLMPGAPYTKQVANCCRGGVLSSLTQDTETYLASLEMHVGSGSLNGTKAGMPQDFTLGVPGYTCGEPFKVPPTKFTEDRGRRRTQAHETWNVTCSYSQFRASTSPTCCVSLSAFYNETIVPCPKCSCACQEQNGTPCVEPGELPPVLQLEHDEPPKTVVQCSPHMCPIRVHWHIKQSYKKYWRVKLTITNLNYFKNYSQWNLVVLHPNLSNVTQVFSFNYKPLIAYGDINDTGLFYGIQYYNDMLLQSGKSGNVQTELLLHKDAGVFSFREGWAFPRKVSFNGEGCVMPTPDDYPRLPNAAHSDKQGLSPVICLVLFLLLIVWT